MVMGGGTAKVRSSAEGAIMGGRLSTTSGALEVDVYELSSVGVRGFLRTPRRRRGIGFDDDDALLVLGGCELEKTGCGSRTGGLERGVNAEDVCAIYGSGGPLGILRRSSRDTNEVT
jgi:hypothetical protein